MGVRINLYRTERVHHFREQKGILHTPELKSAIGFGLLASILYQDLMVISTVVFLAHLLTYFSSRRFERHLISRVKNPDQRRNLKSSIKYTINRYSKMAIPLFALSSILWGDYCTHNAKAYKQEEYETKAKRGLAPRPLNLGKLDQEENHEILFDCKNQEPYFIKFIPFSGLKDIGEKEVGFYFIPNNKDKGKRLLSKRKDGGYFIKVPYGQGRVDFIWDGQKIGDWLAPFDDNNLLISPEEIEASQSACKQKYGK